MEAWSLGVDLVVVAPCAAEFLDDLFDLEVQLLLHAAVAVEYRVIDGLAGHLIEIEADIAVVVIREVDDLELIAAEIHVGIIVAGLGHGRGGGVTACRFVINYYGFAPAFAYLKASTSSSI